MGIGTSGSGDGQLESPRGITFDPRNGDIIVVDSKNNNRISVFDINGNFIRKFIPSGNLKEPNDITFNPYDNTLILNDTNSVQVYGFDEGKLIREFGSHGRGRGQFMKADGIAFEPQNNTIIVSDSRSHKIQVFDGNDGKFITKFGSFGLAEDQLDTPRGIAITNEGIIVIADSLNNRVLILTQLGEFVQKIDLKNSKETILGVGIFPNNDILCATSGKIQIFRPNYSS
jgi:tripartite motif-containing protein 71